MSTRVGVTGGEIEVHTSGDGPLIVLVPSLGRGGADFADLAAGLAAAGWKVARPEPRGVAGTAPMAGSTMETFAADLAAVIEALAPPPRPTAVVVGHALGNRIVRLTATRHPGLVRGVALLAAGGLVAPEPEALADLRACFDPTRNRRDHLEVVRRAFFAPGNDPSAWEGGWYPTVALHQGRANSATDPAEWWEAGSAPVLVIQPAADVIAPAANAVRLADSIGDRATVVTIPDAGHALLPEQPSATLAALLEWLGTLTAER